jgi:NACalpha-BTF3-like transcription factor
MFDPKNMSPEQIKKKLDELGIDMATLEKAATVISEIPELKAVFEKHAGKEGFKGNVEDIHKEVEDIFDHRDTPDNGKN